VPFFFHFFLGGGAIYLQIDSFGRIEKVFVGLQRKILLQPKRMFFFGQLCKLPQQHWYFD